MWIFRGVKVLLQGVCPTVVQGGRAVRMWAGPSARGPWTVRRRRVVQRPGLDCLFFKVLFWRFYYVFGLSARGLRTVRLASADRPPQPCGLSAWAFTESLSPLLLVFRFHFEIIWGLFLGLVGPL
jgi:hypothetical protein